ncbi:Uncharacterised protein [Chlamydia trachomatis]|nr:Uncharacterised protein [Chlamydia trachomatis]
MNKYFLNCFSALAIDGFQSNNVEDITCPLDQDLMDSLCPVNLETGLREDLLVRVNDPSVSDSERQALLASLPKVSAPQSPDVDDETKLMFVKLRSLQTASELSAFRDSIRSWVDSQPSDESSGEPSGEPSVEPSGESSGEPSGE